MRSFFLLTMVAASGFISVRLTAQPDTTHVSNSRQLYIDVHHLGAGKVTWKALAEAHRKDLAAQGKYDVQFLQYWVDEARGNVYCLSSSPDTKAIRETHAAAHGLLPDDICPVIDGKEAPLNGEKHFFLDVHEMGAGNVSAKDLPAAQEKNLSIQELYGVHFINYWADEKDGLLICLSQARRSTAVIKTHKAGHGLAPTYIMKVRQGK